MDFCCIVIGCPTQIKQNGSDNGQTRLCPRCNNVAVFGAKKSTYLEICFVPLFPMSSSSIWNCSICGWHVDQTPNGYAPPLPGPPPPQGGYNPHYPGGYGPPPGQQQWAQSPPNSFQGQPGQYQQPGYGPQPGYGQQPGGYGHGPGK